MVLSCLPASIVTPSPPKCLVLRLVKETKEGQQCIYDSVSACYFWSLYDVCIMTLQRLLRYVCGGVKEPVFYCFIYRKPPSPAACGVVWSWS